MEKQLVCYTQKQRDGIEYAAKIIDFGVSLTVATAINELYTAHMMLRERPDLFRREVKMLANAAVEKARLRRAMMMTTMRSREFFDAYCDRVIDLAEKDVLLFRLSIKQTLDNHKLANAEIISYVETTRALLELGSQQFQKSVAATIAEYGPFNYAWAFDEFNCSDVLAAWKKVCDILYAREDNIDLNVERSVQLFELLADKFASGAYVNACMKEANDICPTFLKSNENQNENERRKTNKGSANR